MATSDYIPCRCGNSCPCGGRGIVPNTAQYGQYTTFTSSPEQRIEDLENKVASLAQRIFAIEGGAYGN